MDTFYFDWMSFGTNYTAVMNTDYVDFAHGVREMLPTDNITNYRVTGWNSVVIHCDGSRLDGGVTGALPPAQTIGDLRVPDKWKPITWKSNIWTDARIVFVESKGDKVTLEVQWYCEIPKKDEG